jgi:hypothetical protein
MVRGVHQSLAVANKALFQNCLVVMQPKLMLLDLPSAHNIIKHLHNEFVCWMGELEVEIKVLSTIHRKEDY